MTLKEREVGQIAERLAVDFEGMVSFDVIDAVLRQCMAKDMTASPDEIEQIVRIQLQIRRQAVADEFPAWLREVDRRPAQSHRNRGRGFHADSHLR
jgi:hypothetical protein